MVVCSSQFMASKKSYKSPWKEYKRRRSGQRGRGIKNVFKKVEKLAKKVVNSGITKMAISQGLAYAPKLYDMSTSKIGNKMVKKLLQSDMAKYLLNKGQDKAYWKPWWSPKDSESVTQNETIFSKTMEEISLTTLSVFFGQIKKGIFRQNKWKRNKVSPHGSKYWRARKPRIHWWSFLDTDEKDTLFLSDSFGSYGLLNFIVNSDLDVFKHVIPGHIKQIFRKNNKITLLKWSFKLNNYKKLKRTSWFLQPGTF